ncbi:hypothetical protein [Desulfohalovibrio reitneri]|uniref:hypothetical protein n=1 Tax=Desulfohalovibrio reitneri TaxID=1307759 RepID=UPI0004A6CC5A|nr:hypothetical protein [Desulfohalovibrio reitneri]
MLPEIFVEEFFTTLRLLIVFAFVYGLVRLAKGRRKKHSGPDDAETMQDLYHGMERMEERIENLETLMLERDSRSGRTEENK